MLEAADTNLGRRTPRRAALEPACSHGRTSNSRASPCQHLHRSGTARPIDAAAEAQSQPSAARAGVPRVPQWQATSQAHRRGHGCPSAPGDVAPWRRQHDRRPPPVSCKPTSIKHKSSSLAGTTGLPLQASRGHVRRRPCASICGCSSSSRTEMPPEWRLATSGLDCRFCPGRSRRAGFVVHWSLGCC